MRLLQDPLHHEIDGAITTALRDADHQLTVLIHRVAVRHRHRRIVHRGHRDRHRLILRLRHPIADTVGEHGLTGEIRGWRIGERAARVQHQGTGAHIRSQHRSQLPRGVVDITRALQHPEAGGWRQHLILRRHIGFRHARRRIVYRVDRDRHCRR